MKMKKWLILESNKEQASHLATIITNRYSRQVEVFVAETLTEGYEIVFQQDIDLFFVNIILNEEDETDISGIRFMRNIRDINRYIFTPVIYVTTLTDFDLAAYTDPNCMGYVHIPYNKQDMLAILEDSMRYHTPPRNREVLYSRTATGLCALHIEDLVYVEFDDERARIHTVYKTVVEYPGKICRQSLEELGNMNLVQCSDTMIVNCFYLRIVDRAKELLFLRGWDEPLKIQLPYASAIEECIRNNK